MKIGRNDPCPCGSGIKYKRCCLFKESEISTRLSRYRHALFTLTGKLIKFSFLGRFKDDFKKAMEIYYVKEFSGLSIPEHDIPNSMSWFIFDYELWDGETIIAHFIKERFDSLNPLEKELALLLKDSYISLFEVQEVRPGRGLTLEDIFTNQKFFVEERMGSERIQRWAILACRIITIEGINLIAGGGLTIPPIYRQSLIDYIWTNYVKETREKIPLSQFLKGNAERINWFWMEVKKKEERRLPPRLVTTDGHEFIFAKAIFEVKDFERAKGLIRGIDGFEVLMEDREGIEIDWYRESKVPLGRLILGHIKLTRDRLTLECKSRERLDIGKGILLNNLGNSVVHKFDTFEDVESLLKDRMKRPRVKKVKEIPKEIQNEFLKEYLDAYYESWIDMEIPALDNKRPKEAANDPRLRDRLIQLLKEMEFENELRKKDGLYVYDFDIIRKKLGLI